MSGFNLCGGIGFFGGNIGGGGGGGISGSGTTNYLAKFTGATAIGDSQIFDNGTQIDFFNSSRSVLSILSTGLDINTAVSGNDAVSYYLKFFGTSSTGTSQSGVINFQGGGDANGGALIITNNNGSINLVPSDSTIWLQSANTQIYSNNGGLRLTNNSTTTGILVGNYQNQTSGTLFSVVNFYQNVGNTFPFTVFAATGNVLLGTTSQTDAGFKLDVVGTARANSFIAAGTGGNGFYEVVAQSSAPSTPASGLRLFANASNTLSWINTSGFVRNIDGSAITANRTYGLPNKDITFAGIADETFTGLTTFNGTTQTGAGTTGILRLNQTWNTSGNVNGILLNITNTASGSSSTGLLIQEGSANRFRFLLSSASLAFGSGSNNIIIGSALATNGNGSSTGTAMRLVEQVGNNAGYGFWFIGGLTNRGYTSGTGGFINGSQIFNPTSGTAVYNYMRLGPTIGQSGSANGITRSLFIDSTITGAADFRAIDSTNGRVLLTDTYGAGSGSLAYSLLDLAQTWNTSGSPTAIKLTVTDTSSGAASNLIDLLVGANSYFKVDKGGKISQFATNTAAGTTGDQTINRPTGTVNIAAGGTSVTVTNNLVTTSSLVFAVIRTNDATAVLKNVVPGAGSFVITLNAATTAETSIGFWVIN